MDPDKIKQIIKKLEFALPPDGTGPCTIDADTVLDVLEILDDLPFHFKLLEATTNRCEQINQIGADVRCTKNKPKAYREAAKTLEWSMDHRGIENEAMFADYLDLIGAALSGRRPIEEEMKILESDAPIPALMEKADAIEFLTKKYQIQSFDATYQRLKRTKKNKIKILKSENKDYSYLINILPSSWPQV